MYYFFFALAMLTPVFMSIVGVLWRIKQPDQANAKFAYRTALSNQNADTWAFTHLHCAKLWLRLGLISAIITVAILVGFQANYQSFVLWLIVGQMAIFCVTVFFVDTLLKAVFDENGNRR